MKNCSNKKCLNKNPQSISNFNRNKSSPDGLGFYCKQCKKQKDKEWYNRNKEHINYINKRWNKNNLKRHNKIKNRWAKNNKHKVKEMNRKYELKKKYGITIEEYIIMLKNQNYKCLICNLKSKKNLCVDHCHKTNKVRGLLCKNCNFLLGNAKDNINILKKAIKYLRSDV